MLNRAPDVGDDRIGQADVPGRIVQLLHPAVADVLVVEEPLDRRRPEQRASCTARGTFAQHRHQVGRILGRRRQSGMLEVVDAGEQTSPDLFRTVRVRDDGKTVPVRFVDDGANLVDRHLVLVDQLDDVDTSLREPAHLGARVVGTVHPPTEQLRPRIRCMLNERPGDVQRRAWNSPGVDPVAHGERRLQRRAEVARARHPREQKLSRRRGHDYVLKHAVGHVRAVPVRVVGVTIDHQVDVHVPQAGEHAHPFGRYHLGPGRDGEASHLADRPDPLSLDQDDTIAKRRAAVAIDQLATDESEGTGRRALLSAGGRGDEGEEDRQPHCAFRSLNASYSTSCLVDSGIGRPSMNR
jgi:hypothetical protein